MLFKIDCERTEGPATPAESNFEFLQRSNHLDLIKTCRWINEWFDEFPSNAKPGIEGRIKGKNDKDFIGAYFELLTHRMLRSLGLCIEVERSLPSTDERIDFLAHPPSQKDRSFFVEATVSGFGQDDLRENANERNAVEKIRRGIPNPHSDIWLEADGTLHRPLKTECVVKPFRELLERHTAAEILGNWPTLQDWSRVRGSQPWLVPYAEIKRKESEKERKKGQKWEWVLRGYLGPPMASTGMGQFHGPSHGGPCDGSSLLRNSLSEKAKKWRKAVRSGFDFEGRPLLIAVNGYHRVFFWDDICRALFANPNNEWQSGAFCWSLRNVDGVIVFDQAAPRNEQTARVQLFRNGNARLPECLHFLLEESRLGRFLGIEA